MTSTRLFFATGLVLCLVPKMIVAQQASSFARDVKPFLARYCLECHNSHDTKGDLDLETFKGLAQGGKNGPVLVAGKPEESRLVLLPEHKTKPHMPPSTAKQPPSGEVAVLRAWVAAGAKDDSATLRTTLPDIQPRAPKPAPVSALAFRPDGQLLAAGGHREVVLLDPASGDVVEKLSNLPGKVSALAFSRDGQRLAVASSNPGKAGELHLFSLSASQQARQSERVLAAHKDTILDLAFSPDGKLLASAGYDRVIRLLEVATGREICALTDHSDAVYSLAFSPDGQLLASASADRTVKIWDVTTANRLYTLGEATDWLYAVAWSSDGLHLAAGGVDKSIRIWQVSRAGGRMVLSAFAHEAPVMRLVYGANGKTLYSLGEDRVVKAWDSSKMIEQRVYAKQPEAVLALALGPDRKQIALGRYDGTLVVLDEATGKVQSEPLPIKPKPPQISKVSPSAGRRGEVVRLTFEGKYLENARELTSSYPGVTATLFLDKKSASSVAIDVTFPPTTPAGVYKLGLKGPLGESSQLPFTVDLFPVVNEVELNDSLQTAQSIPLPASVVGAIRRAGNAYYYRFEVPAHQQFGAQVVTGPLGSKLDPVLQLLDRNGEVLAESFNGVLGYDPQRAGTYLLGVRDREYRGGQEMHYRLHIGSVPVVSMVYPLGVQRGTETKIQVQGVHLGSVRSVKVMAPADAVPGSRISLPLTTPFGPPLGDTKIVVGEFPEVTRPAGESGPAVVVPVPGTANGRISSPGATQTWRFPAQKGQRLILEVNARRLGSPLDSYIEILDAKGQAVPRATLRSTAKTYVTFRDHDSARADIRIESWNELAINDYVWVGNELLRVKALPKHPDDDCQFFSAAGQRIGYLDTTPTHVSSGVPIYKVTIHPPGTPFPPNGFPLIHLDYRNDDGGPGYGKDSRLFFDPPADGEYRVRIGDTRGQGDEQCAYRLTIRPPEPSFTVSFNPTSPAVWKGGAIPITISANRADGFDGAIDVRLENLPPGFSAPDTSIPAGENSTAFAMSAEPGAAVPAKAPPLKLVARAKIDGKDIVREVTGGLPKSVEPGDILASTEQSEVTVRPGQQATVTARIERRNDFKGRVPLDVRGLPHGVRVLDIGLNGILITEKETSRTFVIYAEPWVPPTTHPFVVLARHEAKGTEHAARSLLLKVISSDN